MKYFSGLSCLCFLFFCQVDIALATAISCPVNYQLPTSCENRQFMQTEVFAEIQKINQHFREHVLTGIHQDETNHPEVINQKSSDAKSDYYFCLQRLCEESIEECAKKNPTLGGSIYSQSDWCMNKAQALVRLKSQEISYTSTMNQARKERNLFEEKQRALTARFREYLHDYLISLVQQLDRFESRVNYFIQNPLRD